MCCQEGVMNSGQSQIADARYTVPNHFLLITLPIFNSWFNENNSLQPF